MTTKPVPHEVIPCDRLPAGQYRDLPEPPHWRKLVGPSILLLGLSLGSGEFVLWPYITYKFGFVVFWACMVGVLTQYFINMEIERWTLATGETTVTGFCRLWSGWAGVFLLCNVVPWMWPGWASGAATILTWEFGGDESVRVGYSIASLLLVGLALSLGPVVYRTVERIQTVLIAAVLVLLLVIFFLVVEPSHVWDLCKGIVNIGHIPEEMELPLFLGALAFAGAGGTMNLAQSDFIRDKGYAMGAYMGRLTSPLTGREEAVDEIGYHFEQTPENMRRWRGWWQAANRDHLVTFYALSALSLMLLSLIAYATTRQAPGLEQGLGFIGTEGDFIAQERGSFFKHLFNWMGIAILPDDRAGAVGRLRSHLHRHRQDQLAARTRQVDAEPALLSPAVGADSLRHTDYAFGLQQAGAVAGLECLAQRGSHAAVLGIALVAEQPRTQRGVGHAPGALCGLDLGLRLLRLFLVCHAAGAVA